MALDTIERGQDSTVLVVAPRDPPEVLARFQQHLDLVEVIALQVWREVAGALELEDLRSMGQKGLLEAARRFDETRGVAFRHYANYRVRGAMLDGVRQAAPLPRRVHAKLRALAASNLVSEAVAEEAGTPAAAAIQSDPQAADQRLADHLAEISTAMAIAFVRNPTGLGDVAPPDPELSPEETVAEAELFRHVVTAMADLPDDERAILEGHYLRDEQFDQVAASLGLSKSWASRLHARAIARLTKRLRSMTE